MRRGYASRLRDREYRGPRATGGIGWRSGVRPWRRPDGAPLDQASENLTAGRELTPHQTRGQRAGSACHRQQITIPLRLRGVGSQGAVRAVGG